MGSKVVNLCVQSSVDQLKIATICEALKKEITMCTGNILL